PVPDFDAPLQRPSIEMDEFGIVGVLDQHPAHAVLPEQPELLQLRGARLTRHRLGHQHIHARIVWNAGSIDIHYYARPGVPTPQSDGSFDRRVENEQIPAGKTMARTDALESRLGCGTCQ